MANNVDMEVGWEAVDVIADVESMRLQQNCFPIHAQLLPRKPLSVHWETKPGSRDAWGCLTRRIGRTSTLAPCRRRRAWSVNSNKALTRSGRLRVCRLDIVLLEVLQEIHPAHRSIVLSQRVVDAWAFAGVARYRILSIVHHCVSLIATCVSVSPWVARALT